MKIREDGVAAGVRYVASPNCDERPPGIRVSLLLLHSISLPPASYGGDAVERLFTNRLDPAEHPYFRGIAALKVSSHFFVRRDGGVVQFVPVHRRAWHAGESCWRGRQRCNDYSVGIELEGTDHGPFDAPQYVSLIAITRSLCRSLPLREFAGHSDVAPGRKSDPGVRFDWSLALSALSRS
jgi:N-acetyl-anhydromuramoyl-L-alanine amidase